MITSLVEYKMQLDHDKIHRPYDVCFRVDWWNHGIASAERIAEARERVGEENVRLSEDKPFPVLWVWERSPVSDIRWVGKSPFMGIHDERVERAYRAFKKMEADPNASQADLRDKLRAALIAASDG